MLIILKVVILKRLDEKYIEFGWLDDILGQNEAVNEEVDVNQIVEDVKLNLKQILSGERKLRFRMTIPIFYSESQQVRHFKQMVTKLMNKLT